MTALYEYEWPNVVNQIAYPFEITPPFGHNTIIDLTVISRSRLYLKRLEMRPTSFDLFIAREGDDLEVMKAESISYAPADIDLVSTITGETTGVITIGEGIREFENTLQSLLFTSEETRFEYWTQNPIDVIQSVNTIQNQEVVLENGFNFDIREAAVSSVSSNIPNFTTVRFRPELGAGLGEFCGQPIFLDGIYNINGIIPDSLGNIEFAHLNQFLIDVDPDNNTVIFDLAIPENRLDCERTFGFAGPDGFQGALGPDGLNGTPGSNFCVTCDTCNTNDSSALGGCCECDVVEDAGETELTPEELFAELGLGPENIDNDLLELLGLLPEEDEG